MNIINALKWRYAAKKFDASRTIPDKAIEIIKKVLSAIGYAHNKNIPISGYNGILHLDIKPGNIINLSILREDEVINIKLIAESNSNKD